MWVSTSAGLAQLDAKATVRTVYTARDGLQSNEFTSECFRSASGELLFGGVNGFNAFDPIAVARELCRRLSPSPGFAPVADIPSRCLLRRTRLRWPIKTMASRSISPRWITPIRRKPVCLPAGRLRQGLDRRRDAPHSHIHQSRRRRVRVSGESRQPAPCVERRRHGLRVRLAVPPWRTWWAYTLYGLGLASGSPGSCSIAPSASSACSLHKNGYRRSLKRWWSSAPPNSHPRTLHCAPARSSSRLL